MKNHARQALPRGGTRAADWAAWPNILSAGVMVLVAALVLATFQDYGISWDEMLQNTYGKLLLKFYTSGFEDDSALHYVNLFMYGGFFDLMAALLNLVSPYGEYETRHLLGGVIFIAGLIGAWRLANLLGGNRAALLAVLFLATTPLLYGHAFINPKDSPLAWFLIWVLYYGCRILESPEHAPPGAVVGFGISLGLALATRVIAVAYPAYLAAVMLVSISVQNFYAPPHAPVATQIWRQIKRLLAAAPIALALMAVFWPWSVQSPLNIVGAAARFANFDWHPLVLWGGEQISSTALPASYLARLLSLQLPEYVLLGLAAAVVFAAQALIKARLPAFASARGRQYVFVALSFAVPLIAFMVLRPVIYNGIRHFLFLVPPLVVISALGIDHLLGTLERSRLLTSTAWALLVLGWAWQSSVMLELHPYQYAAYNTFAGGLRGAEKNYEMDYWGTSLGEASRGLAAYAAKTHAVPEGKTVKAYVCGDRMSAAYFLPKNIEVTDFLYEADFFIGINDPPCRDHFGEPRDALFQVQRVGVTLSFVLDLRGSHAVPNGDQ